MQVTLSSEILWSGAVALAGGIISWLAYLHVQIDGIRVSLAETRVENRTLWDFQLRRGVAEAIGAGVATKNSPVTVKPEYLVVSEVLGPPLRDFYSKIGRPGMTNAELAFMIERHFGQQIVDEVCIPHKITHGACMVIAIAIARGTETIDL